MYACVYVCMWIGVEDTWIGKGRMYVCRQMIEVYKETSKIDDEHVSLCFLGQLLGYGSTHRLLLLVHVVQAPALALVAVECAGVVGVQLPLLRAHY